MKQSRFTNGQKVKLKIVYGGHSIEARLTVVDNRKVKYRNEYCIEVVEGNNIPWKVPTKYLKAV